MDNYNNLREPSKKSKMRSQKTSNPQLFYDTSTQQQYPQSTMYQSQNEYSNNVYNNPIQNNVPAFPVQNLLQDPMTNLAMQYGQTFADQGKDYVHQHIEKYVSTSKLKYYFAVDTNYVAKKLSLILFPYLHKDWSVQYHQDEPVAPRDDVNARDLYIPVMSFVTYVLLCGVCLGIQEKFTPESLGIITSSALAWLFIEIILLILSIYILNVNTDLNYTDLLSCCGYKYVGTILCLLGNLFSSTGYYLALLWCGSAISFFLLRSLKLSINPHNNGDFTLGNKRRVYTLMVLSLSQPVLMWWLTYSI